MKEKLYYNSILSKTATISFILLLILLSIFCFLMDIYPVGILSLLAVILVVFLSRKQWDTNVQLKFDSSGVTTKDKGIIKWSEIEYVKIALSGVPIKGGGLYWALILQDSEKKELLVYKISRLNSSKIKIENDLGEFWIKSKKQKRLKFSYTN